MNNIVSHFLLDEQESHEKVIQDITQGVQFRGTNLWILIFAILVASLGLNVNSTAVIIGAMLISPLMGPIMGLGLSLGTNDLGLLRTSATNFLYAVIAGLITSTLYFLLTPLNDAHSELLARTYPTIYDVLIAFFGGLAGIVATSSKLKGNVLPGVAIATALMPPLCTAGYGLATMHWNYFFGAFYLFLINTVFIATATLVCARLLRFPQKHLLDRHAERRSHRIVVGIVVVTLLPSIYLGFQIVQQDRFIKGANTFIDREGALPNDYLLSRRIDPKSNTIVLTYGGSEISELTISTLRQKLKDYGLPEASLEIRQGFSSMGNESDATSTPQVVELEKALRAREAELKQFRRSSDSLAGREALTHQLYRELATIYPSLVHLTFNKSVELADASQSSRKVNIVTVNFQPQLASRNRQTVDMLLRRRLQDSTLIVLFEK